MISQASLRRRNAVWLLVLVLGLVLLAGALTYLAGGTVSPIPHTFYVPVVLAAGTFGARAGFVVAVVAGLICGPWMPLNVAAGTSQTTVGWLIRLGFFALVALVVGYGRNRLLELSAARQRFLSTVSHELRTPLASIVGFAALLADRDLDIAECEQNAFVDLILAEATEMANVVDHYVIEGRLLDSALFIDLQPTDMKRVVEVVSDSIPASVRETRLEIRGGRAVCNADPLRLRQVLRSLVNNALAYSSGRIVLEVAAVAGEARLTVSRSVDRSDSDREGRAPWSPPDETSPPFGLGLAVSRDLVQRMGGQLTYQLNGTTNFVLRMPLADRLSSRGRRIQAMAWPIGPHGTPRIG